MSPFDVIKGPLVTEKSEVIRAEQLTLSFRVSTAATKTDIRNAVQKIVSVKVADVRTAHYKGKIKRRGRYSGYRPNWKKAFVKLADGEKMVEYAQI